MADLLNARPSLWTRLPVGGWQVGIWTYPDGQPVIDVAGPGGSLAYRAISARGPVVSIDAGWAGCAHGLDGRQLCWALAVGHAPARLSYVVSFGRETPDHAGLDTRRDRMTLPHETSSGLWVTHHGLWVAAATGSYRHVRLTARSVTRVQQLRFVGEEF